MIIEVRLFGHLRRYLPKEKGNGTLKLEIETPAQVADVLEKLNVTLEEPMLILVNGVHATLEKELSPGDVVSVFPPLGGG
ncbi:Molybdopterin converting factor, small subunit [Thermanaeromonas toyohensis ToBE]|uniref:Molybdopterin converting factor, small subunit n=1 Tax=Thermanaeromonas toyohensis ToBE TaxID=698762 RepID=A0A1W1VYF0_9FIRM|nr:MoaD/ThiS family protein [Thermanaeromonas toyohensis]SMB98412.1 Molybdopterin converting factor, small subunit [Thermanaeromonas toyohensis ToBE]